MQPRRGAGLTAKRPAHLYVSAGSALAVFDYHYEAKEALKALGCRWRPGRGWEIPPDRIEVAAATLARHHFDVWVRDRHPGPVLAWPLCPTCTTTLPCPRCGGPLLAAHPHGVAEPVPVEAACRRCRTGRRYRATWADLHGRARPTPTPRARGHLRLVRPDDGDRAVGQ